MNVQRNAMRGKSGGRGKALSSVAATIQPHGLLFAIDAGTFGIKHVSANVADMLGLATDEVIGAPISDLVDEDYAKALASFSATAGRAAGPSGRVTLRGSSEMQGWRAASHRSGNMITLEAAPVPAESPELDGFLFDATAALRAVRDHAGIEATATTVARACAK